MQLLLISIKIFNFFIINIIPVLHKYNAGNKLNYMKKTFLMLNNFYN